VVIARKAALAPTSSDKSHELLEELDATEADATSAFEDADEENTEKYSLRIDNADGP